MNNFFFSLKQDLMEQDRCNKLNFNFGFLDDFENFLLKMDLNTPNMPIIYIFSHKTPVVLI